MLLQQSEGTGISSLQRLLMSPKEDSPESHWNIRDNCCFENCLVEGDGPFLSSLPISMTNDKANKIFFILPIEIGD